MDGKPELRTVVLPRPRAMTAVKLDRLATVLARRASGEADGGDERRRANRRVVADMIRRDEMPAFLERPLARALVDLVLAPQGDGSGRLVEKAAAWLNRLEGLRWSDRWSVWCMRPDDSNARYALAHSMLRRLARRPRATTAFPAWLPRTERGLQAALRSPASALARHLDSTDTRLVDWASWSQIPLSTPLGVEAAAGLVRKASERALARSTDTELRAWASEHLTLLIAVLERQILRLVGNATTAGAIRGDPRARRELTRFVDAKLGHPDESPGNWRGVAQDVRRAYRLLSLSNEIDRILELFRRRAETDRHAFWNGQRDQISDALYVDADTAVCMIVIGRVLFIEFGQTGFALYGYDAPRSASLRSLASSFKGWKARRFQNRDTLRIGPHTLRHRIWVAHNAGWEHSVTSELASSRRRR